VTPRAFPAGGAFAVTTIPTSDVLSRLRAPSPGSTRKKSTRECRPVSPAPGEGRRLKRIGTPSVVLGHALLSKYEVCLFCELFGSHRGMAHRFALSPSRTLVRALRNFLQARYGVGFSTPYRGCVRPTSATYCLSNRQPAFSVLVSGSGLRHSRDEEPDVSRRPSSLRPDRRLSMGVIAPGLHVPACLEKAKYVSILASGTSVATSCARAVLSDDLRAKRRGQGCVLPPPREGCRRRNNPKCLPSVTHARAIEHVIDPGCPPSGIIR
jgi:hypothetical protein